MMLDRVQPGGEVGGRPLGLLVVGQPPGDHEAQHEHAVHDARGDGVGRHPFDAELPQHGPDPDENRGDDQKLRAQLEVAQLKQQPFACDVEDTQPQPTLDNAGASARLRMSGMAASGKRVETYRIRIVPRPLPRATTDRGAAERLYWFM
jgi:hypothetical protein